MKKIILLLIIFLFFPAKVLAVVPPDPQYVIMNKCPTCGSGSNYLYYFNNPSSVKNEMFTEIRDRIGTTGTVNRTLGLGFIIEYFNHSKEETTKDQDTIRNILALSANNNVPVLIKLDSHYWEARPDLWNWFEPSKPGFNPNNIENVERTGWDQSTATKIAWFNWGLQCRIPPAPNLGSPQYIEAKKEQLGKLLPIIIDWYKALPIEKKYLLAGVVLDGELSIGVNGFYYPNGNTYFEAKKEYGCPNPSWNPTFGNDWLEPKTGLDFTVGTSGGLQQLGYAAVSSDKIKSSGIININDLNGVIEKHAGMLTETALNAGVPFEKIFVHGGGNINANCSQTFAYKNVVTNFGKPGWSFYDQAGNVSQACGLSEALNLIDNTPWGAVEWFNYTSTNWKDALLNTLNYRSNKLLAIYNWEGMSQNNEAVSAVRDVLNTPPSCWLSSPIINSSVSGKTATLTWEKPTGGEAVYLGISSDPARKASGGISNINLVNTVVTNQNSFAYTPAASHPQNGTYYWQIVVDGCSASGTQRRVAYGSFTINNKIIDITDLRNLLTNFLNPYTIFDYNKIVEKFGG